MSSSSFAQWYQPVDAALYRAVLHPGALPPSHHWPDLDGDRNAVQACEWIARVWSQAHVAEAVTVASPSLAARISRICDGSPVRTAQARSVLVPLARYLVRMSGRPTPFGLFAGVGPVEFAADPPGVWKPDRVRVRTRAHTVWLARIIAGLEGHAELRRRLLVVLNDLAFARGDRLIVPWQPHGTDPAKTPAAQVSLRLTPAVRAAVDAARAPLVLSDLVEKLAAELPELPTAVTEALLAHLVGCGVLITALRPPSTCGDGLAYLLGELAAAGADTIGELRPLMTDLDQLTADLTGKPPAERRLTATARMREMAGVECPMAVDLGFDTPLVLPSIVAREAAAATGALVALTPHPDGVPGWQDYHEAFLARFGAHALVPLARLVDPVAGLGYPGHFTAPDTPPSLSGRDAGLLRLAQQAALDGAQEVVLDKAFLDSLRAQHAAELRIPPHLEMCAQVWAPSMQAVKAGRFRLVLSALSRTGLALTGRFLDLLPPPEQRHRHHAYRELPTGVDGAIAAQLSFPPIHAHLENVARAPQLLEALVCVAEHRCGPGDQIPLDDLAVTADNHGMYLVSLSRRRVVEPTLANAAARRVMPPMVRLLFELPRARRAASSPFAWGAARCLPFLPRVVYGRTVLAMARWTIPTGDLPAADLPDRQWRAEFQKLARRLMLPGTVSVGDSDLRLRLRLDEPMDLAVLRDHLDKARAAADTVMISEAGTAEDHAWLDGCAHEIIVPVASTRPAAPAPTALARPGPLRTVRPDQGVLPGTGRILLAKLYGDPEVFDLLLTEHLPALLAMWPTPPPWWFIRYRDPRPHVRLRLHLGHHPQQSSPAQGKCCGCASSCGRCSAFTKVGAWAERLRDHGLIGELVFDTHVPEITRYGDNSAMRAAEALFAADSTAVLAQLRTLRDDRALPRPALTAAGQLDLVAALAGGTTAGMRWLIDHPAVGPATAPGRELVHRALQLTETAAIEALPHGEQLLHAWAVRRAAATSYRDHWRTASVPQDSVIRSLLHMNYIRSTGIDPDGEHTCQRLVRAVALAHAARRPTHGRRS